MNAPEAFFSQVNNKNTKNTIASFANLEPLIIVTDKTTFEGIRARGIETKTAYVVEGNRDIKWKEARGADKVIENIYGQDTQVLFGIYGEAVREKNSEGFAKGTELILGVNWKLASGNINALKDMISTVGVGNIRLTGIGDIDSEKREALDKLFKEIKTESNIKILRDYKVPQGETLEQAKVKIRAMIRGKSEATGGQFDGIEIDLIRTGLY